MARFDFLKDLKKAIAEKPANPDELVAKIRGSHLSGLYLDPQDGKYLSEWLEGIPGYSARE